MPIRLTIKSRLFSDNAEQEVLIESQVPVQRLLAEIRREFDLPDANYVLTDAQGHILGLEQTLEDAKVKAGAVLVFDKRDREKRAHLRAENGQQFHVTNQTTLIGRPKSGNQSNQEVLNVDLSELDPHRTTSRPHARITKKQGVFFVESLHQANLTFVNGMPVHIGVLHPLKPGDWLRMGRIRLQFIEHS